MKFSYQQVRNSFSAVLLALLPLFLGAQTQPYPGAPNDFQYRFVDGGSHHTVALRCDGTIRTWGSNSEGQLGDNSLSDSDVPVAVVNGAGDTLTNFKAVDAGGNHTLALRRDGTVWAWGRGDEGQLGDNSSTDSQVPVQVNNIDSAIAIAAGDDFSLALLHDSTVVGWGQNGQGQLGNSGLSSNVAEPSLSFMGIDSAISIAAGNCHSMVIEGAQRHVYTVGCDDAGQLGDDGNSSDVSAPVIVNDVNTNDPIENIVGIAGGVEHSIAVRADGTVFTWGATSGGGNDVELARSCSTPDCKMAGEANDGIDDAVAVAAGWKTSIVMRSDSTLVGWGENDNGELGLGFNSTTQSPTGISTLSEKVVAFANGIADGSGGAQHSVLMMADDSLRTWGLNDAGQLGNGSTGGSENTPQKVVNTSIATVRAYAGNDTLVCSGDSAQLGRGIPPEDTSEYAYSWSPTTGLNDPSIPDPKAGLNVSTSTSITYVLFKTYKNDSTPSACIRADSVTVTFNAGVEADLASNAPKCEGEAVDFENIGSNSASYDYDWDFGSGASPASSTSSDPPLVSYSGFGVKSVQLTVFDSVCNDTVTETQGITIHEEPTAGFNSSAPACEDDTVSFNNTGSSGSKWNYSWDLGSSASPNTSTAEDPSGVQYGTSGTKTVTQVISDDNGNCSATDTNTISIGATPEASILSTAPACTGEDVDFDNDGSSGAVYDHQWDFGGGSGPSNSNLEDPPLVSYSSSGNKTVQLVTTHTSSNCTDTAERDIAIHQTPDTGFSSTAPACEGTAVDFSNNGSSGPQWNYDWDLGNGASPSTSTAGSPAGVTYSGSGMKVVTQTISDQECQATFTDTIEILATPDAAFAHDGPSCTGDTVRFSNTGSSGGTYSYDWALGSDASPASASGTDTQAVYSSSGNKQVRLVIENTGTSCTDTAFRDLVIQQTPTPGFTTTAPSCEGAGIDFTNAGSSGSQWTYQWDFGNGASPATSSSEDPSGVSYSNPGPKTVTQTIEGDNGRCAADTTQTVGVLDRPDASFTSTAPGCTGEGIDLSNTGSSGGPFSYQWDLGPDAAPSTSNSEDVNGVSYSSEGIKTIELIIENTNTGCTDTATGDIVIHRSPTVSFTSTGPVCAGEGLDLINTGSSGSQWSYAWDLGAGASPSTSSAENPSGITYDGGGERVVTLTVTSSYCQRTDSMIVNIDSLPKADAGPDTTICADDSVTIGTAAESGNSYTWSPIATLDDPFLAEPTASPVAEFTTYHLRVEDSATGCQARDSVKVTMLGSGLVDAGPDASICKGDQVQLGKGLIEGQAYEWTPSASLDDPSSPHPIADPDSSTIYTLGVSRHGCDTLYDDVEVTVHPLPDAEAGPDVDLVRGERTRLNASGGVAYQWTPDSALSDDQLASPYASPDSSTLYTVRVTDVRGCEAKDSVLVRVITPERFVPSAFSPDGDGRNDVFRVRGPRLEGFRMEIFDRSGERIFMTERYENGWDGRKDPSDRKAAEGAYPYLITGKTENGEEIRIKGMLNLLR